TPLPKESGVFVLPPIPRSGLVEAIKAAGEWGEVTPTSYLGASSQTVRSVIEALPPMLGPRDTVEPGPITSSLTQPVWSLQKQESRIEQGGVPIMILRAAMLALTLALSSCATSSDVDGEITLALVGADLLPMTSDPTEVLRNQTILIAGDAI